MEPKYIEDSYMDISKTLPGGVWRAWFTENREYNSKDHSLSSLPKDGALCFIVWDLYGKGKNQLKGAEWYYAREDGLWGRCETLDYEPEIRNGSSVREEISKRYVNSYVMRGKDCPPIEMKRVSDEAFNCIKP